MANMIIASLCSFFLSLILSTTTTIAKTDGFSVELIHRDSPKSPFYNPLENPSQRVANALHHSISRSHYFVSSIKADTPRSDIISNSGQYLMNISLGTPPFPILAIADTGSDLIWTQCEPCQCFKQIAPLFNPKSSSTYKTIPCSAKQCGELDRTSCSDDFDPNSTCIYAITYGDRSFSNGDLASDTITLSSTSGRPVAFPKTIFGCGNNNDGTFNEKGSGIIGLGRGALSLISQMGKSIGGKFSYCLVPLTATTGSSSKINFGSNGIVSGAGVVSTPLYKVLDKPDTFYSITLEAISVDGERINWTIFVSNGNCIIDSGTTLTLLPSDFYALLEDAVSRKINATRVESPIQGLQLLCYNNSNGDIKVPDITVHFRNADVKLQPLNTFVNLSGNVICFSFTTSPNGVPIYGNLAQMNFLVGYDSQEQTVSFKPTDCTKA